MSHHANNTGGRRSFLKGAAGVLGAGFWADEVLEALPQNTNTNSKPSDLKITDLRIATMRTRTHDLSHHPHRHQPGHLRSGRSARWRQQELRADVEEPAAGREPLQRRQAVPQDQAVRRPLRGRPAACAASKWRCGIWPARRTTCRSTRCSAASSATRSASTATPRNRPTPRSSASA